MSRQARLGLVVLAGVLFFVVALFILANRTFLLSDTYTVRAEFERVSGLQAGATVYYRGISIGRVDRVELPEGPGLPITVVMKIRDDARDLVREDTRAAIQTDGLVGNVIVSLKGGSLSEPVVAENGNLEGIDPFDVSQVSDRLFTSVSRFDSVTVTLTQMMQDVQTGEGSLGQFLYDDRLYEESILTAQQFRTSLTALTGRADALVAIAANASQGVDDIIQKVNTGDGALGRILNEDSVYVALLNASDQFSTISADVQAVMTQFQGVAERMETAAGWGAVGAFRFAENMEALKHNFLFKSYFEERGYLEMAPFEIREAALSETFESLQEWERRLYEQEQELRQIRAELERGGVTLPPAGAPATTTSPGAAGSR